MTATAIHRHSIPDADRAPARSLVRALTGISVSDTVNVTVARPGQGAGTFVVPKSLMPVLNDVLRLLAERGKATVVDDEQEVSPEEAATLLGMSRPMVVHRIKLGDIPHRMVGTHHKLRLSDVLAFQSEEQKVNEALAEIGDHTDEMTIRYGI